MNEFTCFFWQLSLRRAIGPLFLSSVFFHPIHKTMSTRGPRDSHPLSPSLSHLQIVYMQALRTALTLCHFDGTSACTHACSRHVRRVHFSVFLPCLQRQNKTKQTYFLFLFATLRDKGVQKGLYPWRKESKNLLLRKHCLSFKEIFPIAKGRKRKCRVSLP